MPFRLPKSCLDIIPVALARRKTQLIERNMNWYSFSLSTSFPIGFLGKMIVFSDRILTLVPITYSFDQIKAKSVVWNSKTITDEWKCVCRVCCACHQIKYSVDNRHFHLISGETLDWLVNKCISLIVIVADMVLNFIEVNIRSPTVSIDDGQKQIFSTYTDFLKFLLHMFCTPWNVGSFAFELTFSGFMESIVHVSELILKLIHYHFSFFISTFFTFLHCQKNEIRVFASLMLCQNLQSVFNDRNIFIVVRKYDSVKNFFIFAFWWLIS